MAAIGTIILPVAVKVNGEWVEVGACELDLQLAPKKGNVLRKAFIDVEPKITFNSSVGGSASEVADALRTEYQKATIAKGIKYS